MKIIPVFAIVSALFTILLGSCQASPIILEDSTAPLGLKRRGPSPPGDQDLPPAYSGPSTRPSDNPPPYSKTENPSLCYFALDGNKSPTHDPKRNLIYNFEEFVHMGGRFTCRSQPALVPLVNPQDRLCVLKMKADKFDMTEKQYEARGVPHNYHMLTFLGFTMSVYPDMLQNKEKGFEAECYPPEQSRIMTTDAKSIPWHDWAIRDWPKENGKKISVDALASQKGTSTRSSFTYYEQRNGYLGREYPVSGW
ncbi:MAG: hypothetical protein NXY57DRAFT_996835 [Lentinula lateritia]|uniref:Uncharacterized protein n=1 Tax=Lentinula lateritia TaxID=40482 RepID=A0ABQ8VVF3_9AGAR|nr:MAG: hypothetical protein NXY57DRAFT_996835 [Lentinula lateritia]KAJ4499199.1 hypothetical protein C8R41DRAFT_816381 [Lentinula lateritia]